MEKKALCTKWLAFLAHALSRGNCYGKLVEKLTFPRFSSIQWGPAGLVSGPSFSFAPLPPVMDIRFDRSVRPSSLGSCSLLRFQWWCLPRILDRKLRLCHELDNYVWTHIVKSKIEVYGCSMWIVSTRSSTVYVLSSLEKNW